MDLKQNRNILDLGEGKLALKSAPGSGMGIIFTCSVEQLFPDLYFQLSLNKIHQTSLLWNHFTWEIGIMHYWMISNHRPHVHSKFAKAERGFYTSQGPEQFDFTFHEAKWNLGKVIIKPMLPFLQDQVGGSREVCRGIAMCFCWSLLC